MFSDLRKMTMSLLKSQFGLSLIFFVFHQLASRHNRPFAELANHFFEKKSSDSRAKECRFCQFYGVIARVDEGEKEDEKSHDGQAARGQLSGK